MKNSDSPDHIPKYREETRESHKVLVFAAPPNSDRGITGATVGTSVVVNLLMQACEVKWVELNANGLARTQSGKKLVRFLGGAKATHKTVMSFLRLIALRPWKPTHLYYVPSATFGGTCRDFIFTALARLMFRNARILLHIRNGNYFNEVGSVKELLRRYVVNSSATIYVLSERLLPQSRSLSGIGSKFVTVPNTIDEELLPKISTKKAHFCDGPKPSVLYLSNFIEEKGYTTVLQAAEILLDRGFGNQVKFTFRGKWLSTAARADFVSRASSLEARGLEIDVGGSVDDRRSVQSLYAQHEIFCLPSSYSAEAQPRSILEAMANGCAILATDYRAIPDMVVHGSNGLLISRRDPRLLADALISLLVGGRLSEMRAHSVAIFSENFSPDSVRCKLLRSLRS